MSTSYAFQPEAVEALVTAFHKSWSFISDDPCFARQDQILLQRVLSMCLMQLAADGEHDPLQLANAAIYRMRHEYSPSVRAPLANRLPTSSVNADAPASSPTGAAMPATG